MLKKRKFMIGGLVILLALIYLGYTAFQGAATYYYTVSELLGQGNAIYGQNVRVNGQVAADSIEQKAGALELKFNVIEGDKSLPVFYRGTVPDTFKAGIEVVVEGQLNSTGIFRANTLLTKCPSKYVPEK